MNELPVEPALVWSVLSTFAGGGLWFVIRLVHRYQRDFTDRYAARIVQLELENEHLRDEVHDCRQESIDYRVELGAARRVLRSNGIPWDKEDWGLDQPRPSSG